MDDQTNERPNNRANEQVEPALRPNGDRLSENAKVWQVCMYDSA